MDMRAYLFDAGGSTLAHGPERLHTAHSGGVALLTDDGHRIAVSAYGADSVRALRDSEVSALCKALGVADAAALLGVAPDRVASACADLIRIHGAAAGLAPLGHADKPLVEAPIADADDDEPAPRPRRRGGR